MIVEYNQRSDRDQKLIEASPNVGLGLGSALGLGLRLGITLRLVIAFMRCGAKKDTTSWAAKRQHTSSNV